MKYIANSSEGILGQQDPAVVWESLINTISIDFLKNPKLKILNFACGFGTEADLITKRMISLGVSSMDANNRITVNDKGIEFTNRMSRKGYINVDTSDFLQWNNDMNFDVTLANPPYNSFVGDNRQEARNTNNSNLYFDFIKKALKVTPNGVVIMITPSAWMQNDEMRELILDAGLERIEWVDPAHFPSVGIRSGISIFKTTKGYTGDITIQKGNSVYKVPRNGTLSFDDPTKFNIINKLRVPGMLDSKLKKGLYEVAKGTKGNLARLIQTDSNYSDAPSSVFKTKVMIYTGGSREPARYLYHKLDLTTSNYGVALPTASDKHILGAARLINPNEGISDRLKIVYVDSLEQANNLISYLDSKLVRFIVATTKHNDTVNTNKNSFGNIPMVDLNQTWNDHDLYKHFELTQDEIDYIESQFN